MIEWYKHQIMEWWKCRLPMWVAFQLPHRVAYFAYVRVHANATQTERGQKLQPGEISWDMALKEWDA